MHTGHRFLFFLTNNIFFYYSDGTEISSHDLHLNHKPSDRNTIMTFQNIYSTLTRTCQTFSLTPSKLPKRMLAPTSPRPPHRLLGVMVVSLTVRVLLLYSSIFTGRSTFTVSTSFSVSLSLFCQIQSEHPFQHKQGLNVAHSSRTFSCCCDKPTSLVSQMEIMKSKNGSSPAR